MSEQEKSEGSAEDESPEQAGSAAEEKPAAAPKAAKPRPLPGGASPQRPARPGPLESKATTKEPPPPGGIADLIAQALPDTKLEAYQGLSDVIIEVDRDDIPTLMPVLKDDPRLDMKFLRCLFGVDLQDDGFEVIYQLASLERENEVVIKVRLPRDDLHIPSVTPIWKGANWHERETRDMFGIIFDGHPNLVPLLLPEDMTDHFPLRKDNPLAEIAEWQGEFLAEPDEESADGEEETKE